VALNRKWLSARLWGGHKHLCSLLEAVVSVKSPGTVGFDV
jgi:hypothetical protein